MMIKMYSITSLARRDDALDLGCGAGRDTRYLLAQGFHVTAVDKDAHAFAVLAELPQKNLKLVQAAFEDFSFEVEAYDIINAHFSLPFTEKDLFDGVFARLKNALRPGGIFVGQFFGTHDSWNIAENAMTFLTEAQAKAHLEDLKVLEFSEEDKDGATADGTPKHWHVYHIIAQKMSSNLLSASAPLRYRAYYCVKGMPWSSIVLVRWSRIMVRSWFKSASSMRWRCLGRVLPGRSLGEK